MASVMHYRLMATNSSWVRMRVFADAVGLAVVTFLLTGALITVASLNKGVYPAQDGNYDHGTAAVLSCDRTGPVSQYGFGYWWTCRVEVSLSEGRLATTTVGRSIVSPSDVGRQVPFTEHCEGNDHDNCTYGRPGKRETFSSR